jgi:CRP-like cAMP-binding protein
MNTAALSVAERFQTLSLCSAFSRLPPSELGILAEMMETNRLGPGDVLFEHGTPSDRIYVVASGTLSVWLPGQSEPVRQLGHAELLGEYGML